MNRIEGAAARVFTDEERASYARDGFLHARGVLSRASITRLLAGIDRLLCEKLPGATPSSPERLFDDVHGKILALARHDRRALSRVYDAIRKLLPFWQLVGEVGEAYRSLAGAREPGVVFRGCGIRLDLPGEDRWRSQWHQEYHSQISSVEGVTAWFNLVPVTFDMGPVELLRGSHREGIVPVRCPDPLNRNHDYTQTFLFANEEEMRARYPSAQVETDIGDVVFLHFLTVHQSGWNRSTDRSRITCQVRLFDMIEAGAVAHDWVGGWQDGGDFTKLHPEKVLP